MSKNIDDGIPENVNSCVEAADADIQQPQISAVLKKFLRINQEFIVSS